MQRRPLSHLTYLAEILSFFQARTDAGAAIGKLLRYDLRRDRPTDVIDTAGLVLTRQRRSSPRGEGERDVGQYDEAIESSGSTEPPLSFVAAPSRRSASTASTS